MRFNLRNEKYKHKAFYVQSHVHFSLNIFVTFSHLFFDFKEILDKGDDFEEVPNTKFSVTRTAYKDNSSFYQVLIS